MKRTAVQAVEGELRDLEKREAALGLRRGKAIDAANAATRRLDAIDSDLSDVRKATRMTRLALGELRGVEAEDDVADPAETEVPS